MGLDGWRTILAVSLVGRARPWKIHPHLVRQPLRETAGALFGWPLLRTSTTPAPAFMVLPQRHPSHIACAIPFLVPGGFVPGRTVSPLPRSCFSIQAPLSTEKKTKATARLRLLTSLFLVALSELRLPCLRLSFLSAYSNGPFFFGGTEQVAISALMLGAALIDQALPV